MSNHLQPSTTFKAPSRKPYLHTFSPLYKKGHEGEGEGRQNTFNNFHTPNAIQQQIKTLWKDSGYSSPNGGILRHMLVTFATLGKGSRVLLGLPVLVESRAGAFV